MGEAAEKLKELLGYDGALVKGVEYAETFFGTVLPAYEAAFSKAEDILASVGVLDKPNPLQEITRLLEEINSKLDRVLMEIADVKRQVEAGNQLITMQLMAQAKARAYTALNHAIAVVQNPDDKQNKNVFDGLIEDSWFAQEQLSLPSLEYWERLYTRDAIYSDGWSGFLYPDDVPANDPPKYVWDYRAALPAYLQILEWHTVVFLATDASYQDLHRGRMQDFGEFLFEKVYKKILGGFKEISPPSLEQMKHVIVASDDANFYYYTEPPSFPFYKPRNKVFLRPHEIDTVLWRIPGGGGHWRREGYIFGAVERYSGYDSTWAYPSSELRAGMPLIFLKVLAGKDPEDPVELYWLGSYKVTIKDSVGFQRFYDHFSMTHFLRTWRQRRLLYVQVGLAKLYAIIRNLYLMFNSSIPDELTDSHALYTAWSVRQVYDAIPSTLKGNAPTEAPISLRQMATVMQPPSSVISLRHMFLLDEELTPL